MYPMARSSRPWVPFPPLICLFVLLLSVDFGGGANGSFSSSHHRYLAETWSSIFSPPVVNPPPPVAPPSTSLNPIGGQDLPPSGTSEQCPGCVDRRAVIEANTGESELTVLRIELIKQHILKKLRLKEPPTGIRAKTMLPKPLSLGTFLHKTSQVRGNDDFYGKTEQVILFPEIGNVHCLAARLDPSACFSFRFPTDLDAEDVTSAVLWVHKERDYLDSHNQTLIVSEVAHWDVNRSLQKSKLLAIEVTSVQEGWVKINLLWAVKHWLEYSELPHAIHVACKTCGMDVSKSPISLEPETKPFLVINTNSNKMSQRPKRNVNCVPGLSECCRESLYVSFADIGWDDWILGPSGYHAYFCRGSCSNMASITQSGSYYTTVMQRVLHQPGANKRPELVPCCTATHLSPIQLIYMDNTKTITQKILPNMVVDACGCM